MGFIKSPRALAIMSGVLLLMLLLSVLLGFFYWRGANKIEMNLQDLLDSKVSQEDLPGIALYVMDPGQGEWSLCSSGKAVIDPEAKISPTDRFRVGDITKTFTAAAVMLLVEDSLLNIDDTIADHVPELHIPLDSVITIRHLLSHRSGLVDVTNETDYVRGILEEDPLHEFTPQELIQVSVDAGSNFYPGTEFRYCDTGYTLLGLIIEKVTGSSYADVVRTRIIEPAGLTNTFVVVGEQIPGNHAHGYYYPRGAGIRDVTAINQSFDFASGNMVSTVRDLARWAKALYGGKVLGEASTAEMMNVTVTADQCYPYYGLGCMYTPGLGYGHNGGTWGYVSMTRYDKENDIAVAGFTNKSNDDPRELAEDVFYDTGYSSKKLLGYDLVPVHPLDGFDNFIQKALLEYGVPGAVVAVVQDDEVVFLKGYGVRKVGDPAPVDENTRFQLASNTKFLTGAAIGALVDEGKVGWDTPIIDYVPEFALKDPYATMSATCRDMLAHRSGLRAYDGDLLNRLGYDRAEALQHVRYLEPAFSFREEAAYSNIGFFVAGEVAARVDNSTWEEVVSSRLFQPLGMDRSSPYYSALFQDDNHVAGHRLVDGHAVVMDLESVAVTAAAGEAVSTGADMARWLRMLLSEGSLDGQQVLKPETVREIFRRSMPLPGWGWLPETSAVDAANGLGCNSYRYLQYRVIEKNGANDGVRTVVTLVPEKKVGIAVLCNLHLTGFPEAVRNQFLQNYLGFSGRDLQMDNLCIQKMSWDRLADLLPTPPENPSPPSVDLDAYTGVYNSELYGDFTVIREGDQLHIKAGPAQYPGNLEHWTGDTFLLIWPDPDDFPGLVTFTISASGQITGFSGEEHGGFLTNFGPFKRVP